MSDDTHDLAATGARLARAQPPEGSGAVAAGTVSVAAGLCESIARAGLDTWEQARGVAVQAVVLRERADRAGAANERAYASARAALGAPVQPDVTGRDATLRAALVAAADTLLTVAALAADCTALAAETAVGCDPALRPDAVAAAELAAGATRAVALLVDVNLVLLPDDERRQRGRESAAAADAACSRARDCL